VFWGIYWFSLLLAIIENTPSYLLYEYPSCSLLDVTHKEHNDEMASF
jgi:hypothetical protein